MPGVRAPAGPELRAPERIAGKVSVVLAAGPNEDALGSLGPDDDGGAGLCEQASGRGVARTGQ
jgi:hypothetical protein